MRVARQSNGLSVFAIAGTRVILIALNCDAARTAGLRGFSFQRGVAGGVKTFLLGKKAFKAHLKAGDPHAKFPTNTDPIQSFLWSDEAARPGTQYDFTIAALYGTPNALTAHASVDFSITTEVEDDGKSAVYFNRGAIASQAFAENFGNKVLTDTERSDIKLPETQFLSRGLVEGFLKYVDDTKPGEGLRVVAYEHDYPLVLNAFKKAHDRGVDIQIVYDGTQGDKAKKAREASGLAAIRPTIMFARTRQKTIAHNKFIVRLDAATKPVAVWTGSTNFTSSGFLGQTNVGHVVHDGGVAKHYLDFFTDLKGDPEPSDAVKAALALSPNPPNLVGKNSITTIYSPRGADRMLNWYGQRVGDATTCVMFTGAFGVDDHVLAPMALATKANNYLLLEKPPGDAIKAAKKNNPGGLNISFGAVLGQVQAVTGKNVKGKPIAKRARAPEFELDKWFLKEELERRNDQGFVFYVHTKVLLVDPLSNDPLVCTGSANYSSNSQKSNDENMLLIRGDTRVADIYLTEFDRLFRHFFFRDVANAAARAGKDPQAEKAAILDETDAWSAPYFKAGDPKARRREMFFANAVAGWSAKAATDPDVFSGAEPKPVIPGFVKVVKPRKPGAATARKAPAGATGRKTAPGKKAPVKKAAAKKAVKKALVKGGPAKKKAPVKKAAKGTVKRLAKKRAAKTRSASSRSR